ncbi:MAG: hypothetical protein ABIR08_06850 [Sphingomonas sp.]
MATALRSGSRPLSAEHRFFAFAAIVLVAATFIGFAPSYYFSGFTGAPALEPIVHLHGVVFTGWILLYAGQTSLVSMGRSDLHRIVGPIGAVLAVAVVALGFAVAFLTAHIVPKAGKINPPIIFPLTAITMFGLLFAAAFLYRRKLQHHKRLMLLATVSLATTPLARIGRMIGGPLPPPVMGMLFTDLFVAALVAYDVRTRGRLHPATAIGGGVFLLSQPLRVAISQWPAWQAIAASFGAR